MEFFAGDFSRIGIRLSYRLSPLKNKKTPKLRASEFLHGDPYENRTRVFAVKGQCLNLLTNGPYGSGSRSRTYDLPGMNRTLWPTELCRHICIVCSQRYSILSAASHLVKHDLPAIAGVTGGTAVTVRYRAIQGAVPPALCRGGRLCRPLHYCRKEKKYMVHRRLSIFTDLFSDKRRSTRARMLHKQ